MSLGEPNLSDAEILRVLLKKATTASPLTASNENEEKFYEPLTVSHVLGVTGRMRHSPWKNFCALSLLRDALQDASSFQSRKNVSWIGLHSIFVFNDETECEREQKENDDAFFRKRTAYAKAKEDHLMSIRNTVQEKEAAAATFHPIISDYAKKSSAPNSINDYFPRGLAWKKNREKKLAAKRDKQRLEAKEIEDEIEKHRFVLSPKSKKILDGKTRPTSPAAASPTRSRKSVELRHDHFSPVICNNSRELTRDLPPFEYRTRVELERKKNLLRQHEFESMKRLLDGVEELAESPKRLPHEIDLIVHRLFFEGQRKTPVRDEHCTFKPAVHLSTGGDAYVPSARYLTPTKKQQEAAEEGKARRERASSSGRIPTPRKGNASSPDLTNTHSWREGDDFLLRAAVWERDRARGRHDLKAHADAEFARAHRFHPFTSPETNRIMAQRCRDDAAASPSGAAAKALRSVNVQTLDDSVAAACRHDTCDDERSMPRASTGPGETAAHQSHSASFRRNSSATIAGLSAIQDLSSSPIRRRVTGRDGGASPLALSPEEVAKMVRFGRFGKPAEPAFASPFRKRSPPRAVGSPAVWTPAGPVRTQGHNTRAVSHSALASPVAASPAFVFDELLARKPTAVIASSETTITTPQRLASPPNALQSRESSQAARATTASAVAWAPPVYRNLGEDSHLTSAQRDVVEDPFDAATLAEVRQWWHELTGTTPRGHVMLRNTGALCLDLSRSVGAACTLLGAVVGRPVHSSMFSPQFCERIQQEFHSSVLFADFVQLLRLMFQEVVVQ